MDIDRIGHLERHNAVVRLIVRVAQKPRAERTRDRGADGPRGTSGSDGIGRYHFQVGAEEEALATPRYLHEMRPKDAPTSAGDTRTGWARRLMAWLTIVRDPDEPVAAPMRTNLSPLELANTVRARFYKDRNYIRLKRKRWATGAISIRLLALALSGAATIILGLSELPGPASWGFALSALVTLVTALEPFFNFRSRWISADEALARWHRAEEDLTIYVETTPENKLALATIAEFDTVRRDEWLRFSQDWLADRRSSAPHS
jgi:hypothetical protein